MPEDQNRQDKLEAAYRDGVVDQRLSGFDKHLLVINGSIEKNASELHRLVTIIDSRLDEKAERVRVHELKNMLSAFEMRMTVLDKTTVKREGPLGLQIASNLQRLELLEASLPGMIMKLKDEIMVELHALRDDNRVREATLRAEKEALAKETEQRRALLAEQRANETMSFTRRHSTAGLSLSTVALLLGALYFILTKVIPS